MPTRPAKISSPIFRRFSSTRPNRRAEFSGWQRFRAVRVNFAVLLEPIIELVARGGTAAVQLRNGPGVESAQVAVGGFAMFLRACPARPAGSLVLRSCLSD